MSYAHFGWADTANAFEIENAQKIFQRSCSGCHVAGGNILQPVTYRQKENYLSLNVFFFLIFLLVTSSFYIFLFLLFFVKGATLAAFDLERLDLFTQAFFSPYMIKHTDTV